MMDFGVDPTADVRARGTLPAPDYTVHGVYAAPEQFTGAAISTATDVYSMGALLSTLLAGEPPLDSDSLSPGELMDAIRDLPAVAPSELVARLAATDEARAMVVARARGFPSASRLARALEGELDAITLMALRKEPERRYAGADALAEDVRRYLRRDRVHARPDTWGYRLRSLVRRQRPLVLASAAGLLVLVVGIGAVSWQQPCRHEPRARKTRREVAHSYQRWCTMQRSTGGHSAHAARAKLCGRNAGARPRVGDAPRARCCGARHGFRAGVVGTTKANLGDLTGAGAASRQA